MREPIRRHAASLLLLLAVLLCLLSDAWHLRGAGILAGLIFTGLLAKASRQWSRSNSGRMSLILLGVAVVLLPWSHTPLSSAGEGAFRYLDLVTLMVCISFMRVPVTLRRLDRVITALLHRVTPRLQSGLVILSASVLAPFMSMSTIPMYGAMLKGRSQPDGAIPSGVMRSVGAAMLWAPTFTPVVLVMEQFPQVPWGATLKLVMPLAAFSIGTAIAFSRSNLILETEEGAPNPELGKGLLHLGLLIGSVAAGLFLLLYGFGLSPRVSVSMAALLGVAASFVFTGKISLRRAAAHALDHLDEAWPRLMPESVLFMASGVFTKVLLGSTLAGYLEKAIFALHLTGSRGLTALIFGLPPLTLIGLHPIVPFSILAGVLRPELMGCSELKLSGVWLTVWVLCLLVSPVSGLNVATSTSFNLPVRNLGVRSQWRFALTLGLASWTFLVLFAH